MSRRGLAFVSQVVADHGHDLGARRVQIPLSQAELARRQGCSAGTVAYYLRQVGDVVVDRHRGGLVVDVAALDAARAAPTQPCTASPHLHLAPAPTSAPESLSAPAPALSGTQVVEVVSTLARCLSQMSSELGALGSQLLAAIEVPASPASQVGRNPRESAAQPASPANVAGGFSLKSVPRKEDSLPSSVEQETRELRGTTLDVDPPADSPPLPYDLVDDLVAPLRSYARRRELPDTVDDNGRQLLATLSEPELRHGVQRAQRECEADQSIRKPLGLLLHKFLTARHDFFAPPPPAPRALVVIEPEAPVDEEAIAAVAALEDGADTVELALVDDEVQTWLAANVVRESIQQAMLRRDRRALRQAAWRRLHPHVVAQPTELAG